MGFIVFFVVCFLLFTFWSMLRVASISDISMMMEEVVQNNPDKSA